MTVLMLILKWVSGKAVEGLKLALTHWKITLCVLAAFFVWRYISTLEHEKETAIGALQKLTQSIQQENHERQLEIATIETEDARQREESALAIHDSIERIKAYYAKQTPPRQPVPGITVASLRDSASPATATERVPGVSVSIQGIPESWPDPDPTYLEQSDEQACAMTTAYYNGLMSDWMKFCGAYPERCI